MVDRENGLMRARSRSELQNVRFALASSTEEGVTKAGRFVGRLAATSSNRVRLFVFQQVGEDNGWPQASLRGGLWFVSLRFTEPERGRNQRKERHAKHSGGIEG